MLTITEQQRKSLEDKIYTCLMGMEVACECGESASLGMGEMGEARDEADRIVKEWAEENNIQLPEEN